MSKSVELNYSKLPNLYVLIDSSNHLIQIKIPYSRWLLALFCILTYHPQSSIVDVCVDWTRSISKWLKNTFHRLRLLTQTMSILTTSCSSLSISNLLSHRELWWAFWTTLTIHIVIVAENMKATSDAYTLKFHYESRCASLDPINSYLAAWAGPTWWNVISSAFLSCPCCRIFERNVMGVLIH